MIRTVKNRQKQGYVNNANSDIISMNKAFVFLSVTYAKLGKKKMGTVLHVMVVS